jgi:glycosyltransferase involved in cell wall biosynthesis
MRCSHDTGVSVVVTLYNYRKYISDCVTSFRKQLVDFPVEMVVVDDASDDGGADIVHQLSSMPGYPVRIISLCSNKGYANARNIGIRASKYSYLKMLDADDMLCDDSLNTYFNFLMSTGECFVHGPCLKLKKKSGIWVQSGVHSQWSRWQSEKDGDQPWKGVHAQGVMYAKNLHSTHGLYDTYMIAKADREMWARFYSRGVHLASLDRPVALYRIHGAQMSKSLTKRLCDNFLSVYMTDAVARRASGDMTGVEFL